MEESKHSVYPEGKKDWYYTLFVRCFSKKYVDRYDKQCYHKLFWFKYTTDGKKCCGLYWDPNEDYPLEIEIYEPDCLFFCGMFVRFIRIHICRIKYHSDDD
jgi:hypothetical protein